METIRNRLQSDKKIYKELYGFDFALDLSPFDLVIDTELLSKEESLEKAVKAIEEKQSK